MRKSVWVILVTAIAASAVLIVFIALLIGQVPSKVNPEAPPILREKSQSFLTDVVGFNLSEYNITRVQYSPQICVVSVSGLPLIVMSFTLQSGVNQVIADFDFTDNNETYTLESYSQIYMDAPAWVYPPYPPDNLLNWTKGFMGRYQNSLGNASYISTMGQILEAVDTLEPLNMTSGNIKLQISVREYNVDEIYTSITFVYTSEGVDYGAKAVSFNFHNGLYSDFTDTWNTT